MVRLSLRYRLFLELVGQTPNELQARLATSPIDFEGEADSLSALIDAAAESSIAPRVETMVESTIRLLRTLKTTTAHPKIVVFSTSPQVAADFDAALRTATNDIAVFHVKSTDETGLKASTFASAKTAGVLVTDQWGEEGLNLSSADAIVHLDVPTSAARLEQRIGRLDRFGRKQAIIRHRILLPSDDDISPWQAWLDFLSEGLHIFNRSVSDVQFLIDDIEAEAFKRLFRNGPSALSEFATEVRLRIADERSSQHEQHALDRLALAEQPVEDFIQTMEGAEEDEEGLERDVDAWILGGLQLKKRPFEWPDRDPFKLGSTPQTLIPRLPWLSLFPADNNEPVTWRRRIATRRNGVALLRPGAPLIDVLERFTRWDDRGTAFMTWRTTPDWTGETWLGFRLCLVVEPNLPTADLLAPSRSELALARRAQQYFQNRNETIYVDINSDPVSDERLIEILERPYSKAGEAQTHADTNLGSRQRLLDGLIDRHAFESICRSVRDGARYAISNSTAYQEAIQAATKAASADLQRRHNRRASKPVANEVDDFDCQIIEAILPGLQDPLVRLDAMGLFVISNTRPPVAPNA
ncbi:RNA polymerase-associated protein RapA [compost metagenome]